MQLFTVRCWNDIDYVSSLQLDVLQKNKAFTNFLLNKKNYFKILQAEENPRPSSLLNIYKELNNEGFRTPSHSDLIGWAKQGYSEDFVYFFCLFSRNRVSATIVFRHLTKLSLKCLIFLRKTSKLKIRKFSTYWNNMIKLT